MAQIQHDNTQLSLTVTGASLTELIDNLAKWTDRTRAEVGIKDVKTEEVEEKSEIHTSDLKAKPTRTRKAKVVEPEQTELDLDGDNEETEEKVYTKSDVIRALKTFAQTFSREEAMAVLKQFKAKSVQDLKENQYAGVMRELEALSNP